MTPADEGGHSLIEAVLLSLLLMVPILWAVGVLADLHRSALAVTAAAREAGLEAGRSPDLPTANAAVARAVERAFFDHGLDPEQAQVDFSAAGLERGATVEIQVRYPVTALQTPLIGRVAGPAIWVDATHLAIVDPYRSRE